MGLRRRLLRYGLVGLSGVVVNLGALWLLSRLALADAPNAASLGAIEISILWNFWLHDRWTFQDRHATTTPLLERLLRFHEVAATSACLQFGCFVTLNMIYACGATPLGETPVCHGSAAAWLDAALTAPPDVGAFKFAAQAAGIAVATALNFLLNLTWTFRIERSRGDDAADGPRGHQSSAD